MRGDSAGRARGGRPPRPALKLQTTTLWYYPSQQYSDAPMGTPGYAGATPAWVVWNLLQRYTREGDLVVDPFCGGGTTMDVARSLGRRALGYDLQPQRADIFRADARRLPLEDAKVDFVFMDPPYSTHLEYSGEEECIGELDAFDGSYFEAMDAVLGCGWLSAITDACIRRSATSARCNLSNAATRYSATRPRKPWAKNSTKRGQDQACDK